MMQIIDLIFHEKFGDMGGPKQWRLTFYLAI